METINLPDRIKNDSHKVLTKVRRAMHEQIENF